MLQPNDTSVESNSSETITPLENMNTEDAEITTQAFFLSLSYDSGINLVCCYLDDVIHGR